MSPIEVETPLQKSTFGLVSDRTEREREGGGLKTNPRFLALLGWRPLVRYTCVCVCICATPLGPCPFFLPFFLPFSFSLFLPSSADTPYVDIGGEWRLVGNNVNNSDLNATRTTDANRRRTTDVREFIPRFLRGNRETRAPATIWWNESHCFHNEAADFPRRRLSRNAIRRGDSPYHDISEFYRQ